MDPLAGLVGAGVIVSWSIGLIRDAGAVLLDMNPDARLTEALRMSIERDGDALTDLHLWRLGPGHLGAILAIVAASGRDVADYRRAAMQVRRFSHLTIEVERKAEPPRRRPSLSRLTRSTFSARLPFGEETVEGAGEARDGGRLRRRRRAGRGGRFL